MSAATTSAVCTLFEGSYHYGVAALANSLYRAGFRGTLYAGHRGPLPAWAASSRARPLPGWPQAAELVVDGGPRIVFLPLSTPHHLTNIKPAFMLALLDGPAMGADALYYIDPDICVVKPWSFFEQWVGCGVALCEDLNSPLPQNHPRRVGWRRYFGERGLALRWRGAEYVNGGFVGVRADDRDFLRTWQQAMELMSEEIGSLAAAKIEGGQGYRSAGFADCFDCSDQDALNAAIEASTLAVSVIGQEAMGFKPGAALLPHAVGSSKPWQRGYLGAALGGVAPRLVDRSFWAHVRAPLAACGAWQVRWKRVDLMAAAIIGRFMRRA